MYPIAIVLRGTLRSLLLLFIRVDRMVAFMGSAQVNPLFTSSNLPVDLCQKFSQVCFHLNYIIENNISALFFTSNRTNYDEIENKAQKNGS